MLSAFNRLQNVFSQMHHSFYIRIPIPFLIHFFCPFIFFTSGYAQSRREGIQPDLSKMTTTNLTPKLHHSFYLTASMDWKGDASTNLDQVSAPHCDVRCTIAV